MASIACVAAAGVLGLAVARWMARRGALRGARIATVVFTMANPLVWEAVRAGKPEEVLAGALGVGLVLAALRARVGVGLVMAAVVVSFVALVHAPLAVVLAIPLGAGWWRSPRRTPDDALALLALLLLLTVLMDPAADPGYAVPFVFALSAWEGLVRRGVPVLSMVCAVAVWAAAGNALLLAVTVPAAVLLAVRLYAPRRHARARVARPLPA